MISLKPKSILQLTVAGFLMVAGILILTLIITARQLDGLSDQSQRMISQSAMAMRASRTLLEQASSMERNARQFNIVGGQEILDVYDGRRQAFAEAANQLGQLSLSTDMRGLLEEIIRNEALAYQVLKADAGQNPLQSYFPPLIEDAYQVSYLVNDWINRQLEGIRKETTETKRLLTIQAAVLVSTALILAGIFTVLITSPLLQIEKAIRQLGGGQYTGAIRISGPSDLANLGERLDWLRSRLGELEKQRSSFLRHVSHELKTPLASMQESAALLHDGVVGELNAEQKEIMKIQSNNCERLQTLIDDLLRHNADNFSVLSTMPQVLRLDKIAESVITAHELALKTAKLKLVSKISPVSVRGNSEQLRVVIDNLVTNAIKCSPESGELEVYVRERKGVVELGIIDQGPGVAPEESDKIFEPFYQGKATGRKAFKGNGLGLAIAREYIQANGGSIDVIPRQGGAHFRVSLPSIEQEEE